MSRLHSTSLLRVFIILALLLFRTEAVQAVPLSGSCSSWRVANSPNVPSNVNFLNSVTAISTTDVWSVGFTYNSSGNSFTLIEHWNGSKWSIVSSPNTTSVNNFLYAVSAISAKEIWAAGSYGSAGKGPLYTLVEHWDGSKWSIVNSPNVQSRLNKLYAASAISASNVWIVGTASTLGGPAQTLVEHWNGSQWSIVSSSNPHSAVNVLYGVTATSANNIWTVGTASNNSASVQTLVEHWNGSQWSIISSPNTIHPLNILNGVAAANANSIWSVGYSMNVSGTIIQTLVERWNGKKWKIVSSPNPKMANNTLSGVAAISTTDVWAVGSSINTGNATTHVLIEHWDGSKWSIVPGPDPSTSADVLNGVAALSVHNIWAVGDFINSSGTYQTLTEFYC